MMRLIFHLCRYIVGILFIFSGFAKAIDPQGSGIKFLEYLQAFGLDFLNSFSMGFAILLIVLEFLVGFLILFYSKIKISSWLALGLMLFFLPLTLYLAITGKVSDCGCFGDAIKLTDWETFYKNLILIVPILIVFLYRKKFHSGFSRFSQTIITLIGLIFIIFIIGYSYSHLPLIDFRPYHIGANIPAGMHIPNDKLPQTKTTFIYEKDGVQQEFDESNYPWEDSSWVYVSQTTETIGKVYEPPIKDFFIEHLENGDITDQILYEEEYTFLLISYNLEKGHWKNLEAIHAIAGYSLINEIPFYALTSSGMNEIENFKLENDPLFPFCTADEKMLKTVIRSNPGLVLLRKGTVIGKWPNIKLPKALELQEDLSVYALSQQQRKANTTILFALFGMLFFVIFLLLFYIKKKLN